MAGTTPAIWAISPRKATSWSADGSRTSSSWPAAASIRPTSSGPPSRVEGVRPGCAVAVRLDAGHVAGIILRRSGIQRLPRPDRGAAHQARGRARSGRRRRHASAQRRRARARGDPEDAVGQAASRTFVGPSGLIHRVEQGVSRPHVASRNAAARCIGNVRVHRRRLRRTTAADRCPCVLGLRLRRRSTSRAASRPRCRPRATGHRPTGCRLPPSRSRRRRRRPRSPAASCRSGRHPKASSSTRRPARSPSPSATPTSWSC